MTPPTCTRIFSCGCRVAVTAPDEDLRWLEEFLSPAFAVTGGGPADVAISFEDDAEAAALPVSGNGRPGPIVFAFETGPVRFATVQLPDGLRLFDGSVPVAIDVADGGRVVRVHHQHCRRDARLRLARIVREYAHNHTLQNGGLVLHAAAVTIGGAAIAITGPRGSGKTTTVLRLLQGRGVGSLSHDRVAVLSVPDAMACGVPTVVALRPGTRAFLPDVTARIVAAGDYRDHKEERARRRGLSDQPEPPPDAVWRTSPALVCEALGVSPVARSPLGGVWFLEAGWAASERLRRLDPADAGARLRNALLGAAGGTLHSEVFLARPGEWPSQAELGERCDRLSNAVPCVSGALPDGIPAAAVAAWLRAAFEGTLP